MKHLLITLLSLSILFVGCKKDETTNNAAKIIGKWEFTGFYINYNPTGGGAAQDYTYPSDPDVTIYVEFKEDNKVYSTYIETGNPNEYDTSSYSVDGDKLVIDGDIYTIKTLTSSTLELYDDSDAGYDAYDANDNVIGTENYYISVYKK